MPQTLVSRRIALKNILVATDFSIPSEIAFAYALEVAKTYGSKLFVGHAVPYQPAVMSTFEALPEMLDLAYQVAQQKIASFMAEGASMNPEAVIQRGDHKRVQRSDKSPLSLFQIGVRYLRWLLARQHDWLEILALRI